MAVVNPEVKRFRLRVDVLKKIHKFFAGESIVLFNTGDCYGLDEETGKADMKKQALIMYKPDVIEAMYPKLNQGCRAIIIKDISDLKKNATTNEEFDAHIIEAGSEEFPISMLEDMLKELEGIRERLLTPNVAWKSLDLTDEEIDDLFSKRIDIRFERAGKNVVITKDVFFSPKESEVNSVVSYDIIDEGDSLFRLAVLVQCLYFEVYTSYFFI